MDEIKTAWLVYLLVPCEMGSEGFSGWSYHSVAFGETDEEIYHNWIENVKKIYGVDLSEDLKCNGEYWSCYYQLCKCKIPTSIYGESKPIHIVGCYIEHNN